MIDQYVKAAKGLLDSQIGQTFETDIQASSIIGAEEMMRKYCGRTLSHVIEYQVTGKAPYTRTMRNGKIGTFAGLNVTVGKTTTIATDEKGNNLDALVIKAVDVHEPHHLVSTLTEDGSLCTVYSNSSGMSNPIPAELVIPGIWLPENKSSGKAHWTIDNPGGYGRDLNATFRESTGKDLPNEFHKAITVTSVLAYATWLKINPQG